MAIDPLTPPPPRGLEIEQGGGKPTNIQWYGWFGKLQKTISLLILGQGGNVYIVAGLPPGVQGQRAFVTDATATVFLSIVAGGGVNKVPVIFNGTNWVIA